MKKKISMGLVLAAVIMLLTVTAIAATQWGVLEFANKHGQQADAEHLVKEMEQYAFTYEYGDVEPVGAGYKRVDDGSELVSVVLEEALYEDEWLYVAMTVKPKLEKTMVIADVMNRIDEETGAIHLNVEGNIRDINQPGTMSTFAEYADANPAMSVKEYAQAHGFEHVVRVAPGMFVENGDYWLQEDGSVRMVVQMENFRNDKEGYPAQIVDLFFHMDAVLFDENGLIPTDYTEYESIEICATGYFLMDDRTRRSIPEDEHQIEGYRGYIEEVRVTPISEEETSVIIRLDPQKRNYGVTQMAGPQVHILSETGEVLFEFHLYSDVESQNHLMNGMIEHNIVMPSAGLAEDSITIRLVSWRNPNIIYDEYTYTLQ